MLTKLDMAEGLHQETKRAGDGGTLLPSQHWRQEDCTFKASLGYFVNFRLVRDSQDVLSKQPRPRGNKKQQQRCSHDCTLGKLVMMRSWLTGGPKEVQEDLILAVLCGMNQGERI